MTASAPLLTPLKFVNQGLFSDHYLTDIVPTLDLWHEPTLHLRIAQIQSELRAMLESIQPEQLDEAQLEEQWIRPVLERLGQHWSVQVKIRYRDNHRKPDYIFTATDDDARALTNQIYQPQQLTHVLALGDAKRWGSDLDRSGGRDERNPSQQIDEYLRYSDIQWGILTDGRWWRLYERGSSKDNDYYAVNLPELLRAEKVDDFKYFYLFFRREAFVKGGWLDSVLQGSITYAEQVSDLLEEQVYDALELLAQGFLDYRRNRLERDEASLALVYEQSLVLLYRLLFILYAESRSVLPMQDNELYRKDLSLWSIRVEAREAVDLLPTKTSRAIDRTGFYTRLSDLFFIIDQGDSAYNVSAYNGRLFASSEYPFLYDKHVGDAYLARAIDKLSRVYDPKKRDLVYVDYRDLDVRHLGAIYEKLLEYQLAIATEPLALKEGKYVPAKAGDTIVKQVGEVYLKTGSNERKITGSYYTPDYIVEFIVQQTLEPLLTEITRPFMDAAGENVLDREGVRRAILDLNVLDPATGSGHFMVAAVAFIARWLTRLNLQPADIEANEDELAYWKRQVVSACVYGIDVNRLAVELARLSLWLATVARGKPLSFLDHHVKHGNALVGARLADIGAELDAAKRVEQQLTLFGEQAFTSVVSDAVGKMSAIETAIPVGVADVKVQEKTYAQLDEALAPFRRLAHVWTARHFGLSLTTDGWRAVYAYLVNGEADERETAEAIITAAEKLHERYRFLHPDLAFPEVFFTPEGKPRTDGGFDAVIGNPPYVRQQSISVYKPYLTASFKIFSNNADLFLYFFERGLMLLKPSRRIGFITSGTYMNSSSAANFRRFIHGNAALEVVANFGENQPFRGAEMVYPTIAVIRNDKSTRNFRSLFVDGVVPRNQLVDALLKSPMVETLADVTSLEEWRFQSVELTELFRKISRDRVSLQEFTSDAIYYGILTGLNDAFYIDNETRQQLVKADARSAEVIQPLVRGQDLRPWYQTPSDLYIICARQGFAIDEYPAIRDHLQQFRQQLEVKPSDWDERKQGTWNGRTAGNYRWYEWHDTVAYFDMFKAEKVFAPDIGKLPRFSWDSSGLLCNDKGFFIVPKSKSLLAILNSRVNWFALSQIATPLRLRAGLWQYQSKIQFIRRLPIPQLTADQESRLAGYAEQITGLARSRYRMHEETRHRISSDLGEGGKLNTALDEWWTLPFPDFRDQVKKAFKRDIPVKERGEWEAYLSDARKSHERLTGEIVTLEMGLNEVVYDAFGLTPEERTLIEQATKYPYGAV